MKQYISNDINKIEAFFKNKNYQVIESPVKHSLANTYSVSVDLKNNNDVLLYRANGKGLSKESAIASAYFELLERFTSRIKQDTCINSVKPFNKEMSIEDYNTVKSVETWLNIVSGRNEISKKSILNLLNQSEKFTGTEFISLINEEDTLIADPKIIYRALSSTGLASGETYEEAVSQAVYEIMERYASSLFYSYKGQYEAIDINSLPDYLKRRLSKIENNNIDCMLINCFNFSQTSTVALILIDKNYHYSDIKFGSHSNILIAIERCITEMFQGYDNKLKDYFTTPVPFKQVFSDSIIIPTKQGADHSINCLPENLFINHCTIPYKKCTGFNKKSFSDFVREADLYCRHLYNEDALHTVHVIPKKLNLLHNLYRYYNLEELDQNVLQSQLTLIKDYVQYVQSSDYENATKLFFSIDLSSSPTSKLVCDIVYGNLLHPFENFQLEYSFDTKNLFLDILLNSAILHKYFSNSLYKDGVDKYLILYQYLLSNRYTDVEYLKQILNIFGIQITDDDINNFSDCEFLFKKIFIESFNNLREKYKEDL